MTLGLVFVWHTYDQFQISSPCTECFSSSCTEGPCHRKTPPAGEKQEILHDINQAKHNAEQLRVVWDLNNSSSTEPLLLSFPVILKHLETLYECLRVWSVL